MAERFRIERFLAEGGMGEVYAASDLELGGQVALKTILAAAGAQRGDSGALQAGDPTVAAGDDAHVARVYDLFRHEVDLDGRRRSVVFLSMELLEGENLAERLRRDGALEPEHALVVARATGGGAGCGACGRGGASRFQERQRGAGAEPRR
ncbi:MAG: hypothetical protein QM757_19715 [Paludibaculum sp.]